MPPPSSTDVKRASRSQQRGTVPEASTEYLAKVKEWKASRPSPEEREPSRSPPVWRHTISSTRSRSRHNDSSDEESLGSETGASRLPSSQLPLDDVPEALATWVRELRDIHHQDYDASTRVRLTAEYERTLDDAKAQLATSRAEILQVREAEQVVNVILHIYFRLGNSIQCTI